MTAADPVAERSLAPVGGSVGSHGRPLGWRALVWPLVVLSAVPMQLAMLERAYCLEHGWLGQDMFWRACFSDLPVQFVAGGLHGGLGDYLSGRAHVDQPVLTGTVMSLVGGFVGSGRTLVQQRTYFLLSAVLATVLLMVVVWLTAATRPRHATLAAHVALSPLVVLVVMVGPDIVGVSLLAAAMWAWSRNHPTAAGVLLGLATMARTYPLLALVALALLALRAGRLAELRRTSLATGGTVAVLALLLGVAHHETLTAAYGTWLHAPAGFGALWFLPQLAHHPLPVALLTTLAVLGMLTAVGLGFVLALGARRRPTWAEVTLVMVAVALVTGKAVPVQASLWLLPLAALAGVRWRDHFIWVGAEALHFMAVWLYAGGLSRPDRGMPPAWYGVFVLVRLAGIGWLTWQVWRKAMARPAHDPDDALDPEADDLADEAAGPLRGASDHVVAATSA